MDWRNLMKRSVTVGVQLLWGGRYGCNNGRYGCTIVMSYIEINKVVSHWLLTFNLCVSVTRPLTCAFHIPCMHTPEIIDMHRGVCDKDDAYNSGWWVWRDLKHWLHDILNIYTSPFHCFKLVILCWWTFSIVSVLKILKGEMRRPHVFLIYIFFKFH